MYKNTFNLTSKVVDDCVIVFLKRCLRGRIQSNVVPLMNEKSKLQLGGTIESSFSDNDWLTQRTEKLKNSPNLKLKKKPKVTGTSNAESLTESNQYAKLQKVVTPLWNQSYQSQLRIKHQDSQKVLRTLANVLKNMDFQLPLDKSGLPCVVEFTRPSPLIERYRNKDEFGIRPNITGETTVGFYVGSPAEGQVYCVEPSRLSNTKLEHIRVASIFQQYLRESPLEPCTDFKKGYWRNLIVRSNIEGDLMAIVIMHPQDLSKGVLNDEKTRIKDFFANGPGSICGLKSLFFQACPHTRCTHAQAPFELLYGEPYIFETIGDLKIRVSPETFLQINTSAANVLYDTIKCFANIREETTVLDICSGAGTISLILAKHANRTVGIELSPQGVEDATFNAELNGIKNATFFQGRAEKLVPEIVPNLLCSELVAIVNPARGGLEYSVIKALRECKYLKKIVYVSCKPKGLAAKNFISLCKPAGKDLNLGIPFAPTYAIPVDLFPLTSHCELVLVFDRP